ncbi:WD repeat-containing protein 74-like isoform 2-T2 [Salvelinus alpinus]
MEDISQVCSVWVGSETGILKGVSLSKKQAFNFCEMNCLSREQEVCAGGVCEWHSEVVQDREGHHYYYQTVWGEQPGQVHRTLRHRPVGINVGKNVCRMRQNPSQCNQVAAGGKENGLKAWDPERPGTPVFTSKNVRNDWLDLRVPEWVRDMAFIADSDKIDTCTGQHQV